VEGARTSMCVSLGARHTQLDGYALLRGALSIFSSRAVWRETTSLTHSNKAQIHLELNHYNPTSLEIEKKGIHYAFETRNLILSGKRDSLTLS